MAMLSAACRESLRQSAPRRELLRPENEKGPPRREGPSIHGSVARYGRGFSVITEDGSGAEIHGPGSGPRSMSGTLLVKGTASAVKFR